MRPKIGSVEMIRRNVRPKVRILKVQTRACPRLARPAGKAAAELSWGMIELQMRPRVAR